VDTAGSLSRCFVQVGELEAELELTKDRLKEHGTEAAEEQNGPNGTDHGVNGHAEEVSRQVEELRSEKVSRWLLTGRRQKGALTWLGPGSQAELEASLAELRTQAEAAGAREAALADQVKQHQAEMAGQLKQAQDESDAAKLRVKELAAENRAVLGMREAMAKQLEAAK
jgi:chromosome segregation ATPase